VVGDFGGGFCRYVTGVWQVGQGGRSGTKRPVRLGHDRHVVSAERVAEHRAVAARANQRGGVSAIRLGVRENVDRNATHRALQPGLGGRDERDGHASTVRLTADKRSEGLGEPTICHLPQTRPKGCVGTTADTSDMPELTREDTALLDFEREWTTYRYQGAKDAAIRATLDLSPTAYYARLDVLLDEPGAWAYAPAVVKRLRNLREARRLVRSRR